MFPIHVTCPHCHESLLEQDHLVHGHPAVHFTISYQDQRGDVYLSSLYGDYYAETTLSITPKSIVRFACPTCSAVLLTNRDCRDCGAPLAKVTMKDGGEVEFCSRYGCKRHTISFVDISRIKITNVMQKEVIFVTKDAPLIAVAKLFRREKCRELPVVDEDLKPIGAINILSILEHIYPAQLGDINVQTFAPLSKDLDWLDLTACDIMKPILHIMDPETPILDAGLYMIRENVSFVIVCKNKSFGQENCDHRDVCPPMHSEDRLSH